MTGGMFALVLLGIFGALAVGFVMGRVSGPDVMTTISAAPSVSASLLSDRLDRMTKAMVLVKTNANDGLAVFATADAALRTDEAIAMRDAASVGEFEP